MKLQSVLVVICLTISAGLIGSMITSNVSAQYAQPAVPSAQQDPQSTVPPSLPPSAATGLPPSLPPSFPSAFSTAPMGFPMSSSIIMPPMAGRYHMSVVQPHNGNNTLIVICDTATGHCWNGQVGTNQWNDMGRPDKSIDGLVTSDGGVQGVITFGNNPSSVTIPKP